MKLLFDENLSASLVELLTPEFPGSVHVEHVLGRGRSDAEVWEFARANGYAIASKDNDFRQRASADSTDRRNRLSISFSGCFVV